MHYIWITDAAAIEPALVSAADALEAAGLSSREGVLLRGDFPVVDLTPSDLASAPLPDNVSIPGFHGLVVSDRLRKTLAAAGVDNVQYFPCRVRFRAVSPAIEFAVANVVGRIAAVDRDASRLVTDESDSQIIEYVESLVLDQRAASVGDLFRLAEAPHLLVASARVRSACEAAHITGVRFQAVAGFSG